MVTKNKILKIIYSSIEDINQQNSLNIERTPDGPLFGFRSDLDSLGLVNLLVNIEENVNDEFDVSISIADHRAMSQEKSPFRSAGTLADYIIKLMNDGN